MQIKDLKNARLKLGLTFNEAAAKSGVPKTTVYRIESQQNKPLYENAEKLMAFYTAELEKAGLTL